MLLKRRSFIRNMALTGFGAAGITSIRMSNDENHNPATDASSMETPSNFSSLSSRQYSGYVDVKAFGAKGDGQTDDRPPIQAAIDSIRQTGGTVFIPAGTYRLSLNPEEQLGIKVYSNMQIIGAGRGNTILKWLDNVTTTSQHYLLAAHNGFVENVTIADFEIDGNKSKRGYETFQIRGEGIEIDGKNIHIRNMYIHDVLGEGIDCDACDGFFVSHVIVENTGGNGIHCSDARVRNVMISNCITRNCAHGRKDSGNIRYGGLVLRGSNIYVNQHISNDDAQVANIEGQGNEKENEIVLISVTGHAMADNAEGFRIGMQGRVVLSHCRSNLPNTNQENLRATDFRGTLNLSQCYMETGDATPYGISMNGTLVMEGCTANLRNRHHTEKAFRLDVNGRIVMRNCDFIPAQPDHQASQKIKTITTQVGLDGASDPVEVQIVGNHLDQDENVLHLTRNVIKGFVTGNMVGKSIRLEGKNITCVNNLVPKITDHGSNNAAAPNYHHDH